MAASGLFASLTPKSDLWSFISIESVPPTEIYSLVLFCLMIWALFAVLETYVASVKSKSWIIMLTSSGLLSLFGTFYVARAQIYSLWTNEHIYADDKLSRLILLFFLATNIMDLIIGAICYPEFVDPFSSIAHHIFYNIFITILLFHGYSRGFVLCFLMEIPTFILALGTVWKEYRSDVLFGVSFLLTRVFYNAYLAYRLRLLSPDGNIWKVCVLVLGLHLFWFSKW